MFEKVNPSHPDKLADRIAGAVVDLAYTRAENPREAVEVLLGHGKCFVIIEGSELFEQSDIEKIVDRITGIKSVTLLNVPQDPHLQVNQCVRIRCGDNGIFKGVPITSEQRDLSEIAHTIYSEYPTDGKYILDGNRLIICQSNAAKSKLKTDYPFAEINPIGDWTGGPSVDSGATNRKLGSDMGDAVTGGGLHGKDLSKADVSINIYCHLMAQKNQQPFALSCAIGDETIYGMAYSDIVEIARQYIKSVGGFEKFAEWGLI